MTADTLLDRLEGVRENGRGRWMARCPAHDDRSPSLSIRETDDGVILVKCFAECPTVDVMAAVGLELSNLYPDGPKSHHIKGRQRQRIPARKVLEDVQHALFVVKLADSDVRLGKTLSDDDLEDVNNALDYLEQFRGAWS